MRLVAKYQQQYWFSLLDYFQEKQTQIFQKIQKPYFGVILGPFRSN